MLVHRDLRVRLDLQGQRGVKGSKEIQDQLVHKEHKDRQAQQDPKEARAQRVPRDNRGLRAQRDRLELLEVKA